MNRKKGIALLATGVVMAAVTLLGVFALQSDTADTGTFSFESQDEASSIDLQIRDGRRPWSTRTAPARPTSRTPPRHS